MVKTAQVMINEGGNMRKSVKKSPTRKRSTKTEGTIVSSKLSANQQRFLQLLITGIENEPNVLAGRR